MSLPGRMGDELRRSRSDRMNYQRRWLLSLLYLSDRQDADYHRQYGRVVVDSTRLRSRLTVNRIAPIYRTALSSLATQYPSCVIMPPTSSYEHIVKSMGSELLLRHHWHTDKVRHTLRRWFSWMLSTGTSALHVRHLREPQSHEGRVTLEAVRPMDIYHEEGARDEFESGWLGVRRFVTRAEAKRLFPKRKKHIDRIASADRTDSAEDRKVARDRIEVSDVYTWDGDWGVWAGDDWLWKGETPDKVMPMAMGRHMSVPGFFWGSGLVGPLIGLQNSYNQSRAQILRNIELMANPIWKVPRTARVKKIPSKAGGVLFYNIAGGEPKTETPSPMPGTAVESLLMLSSEMTDVAGVHGPSMGKRSIGITAAKAMEHLQSADESSLNVTRLESEEAVEHIAKVILVYHKAFSDEQRLVGSLDAHGKIVHRYLAGTDLVANPEVHIEASTLFSDSSKQRDMEVIQKLELELITPDEAKRELAFRTSNRFVLEKMKSYSQAIDALRAIVDAGRMIRIMPNEDLEAYADVFGDFVGSPEFYDVHPWVQEYLRDTLAGIVSYQQSPDVYLEMARGTVVPRQDKPGGDASLVQAGSNSPATTVSHKQMQHEGSQLRAESEAIQGQRSPM